MTTSPFDILFLDDHLVAIAKPPGINTHAPSSDAPPGVVEQLSAALGGQKLGVHQRLDAVTSGVLVFSRSRPGAKGLARQFEQHTLRKHYLALTLGTPHKHQRWQHTLRKRGPRHIATRQRAGDSARNNAETRVEVLHTWGPWTQWRLQPITGRTHQLRAQLAAEQCPVLGDHLYGGGQGPGRALLHAHRLELKHPVTDEPLTLEAPAPTLLSTRSLTDIIRAILSHTPVPSHDEQDDALRLFFGADLGIPGIAFERFGRWGALHRFSDLWEGDALTTLAAELAAWASIEGVLLVDHRPDNPRRAEAPPRLWGDVPKGRFTVKEHGVAYGVDLYEKLGCGLYLDQRSNRAWVKATARGGEVLNLFAYTCAFSVAAAMGGATRTTSVDISRRTLQWGRENFSANGLDPQAHRFFDDECFEALARAARRGERYQLVICDPPSFARHKKRRRKRFSIQQDLPALVEACARVTASPGHLLICSNHRQTPWSSFEDQVRAGLHAARRDVRAWIPCRPEEAWGPWAIGSDLKSLRIEVE